MTVEIIERSYEKREFPSVSMHLCIIHGYVDFLHAVENDEFLYTIVRFTAKADIYFPDGISVTNIKPTGHTDS
jgi:hypothetical protein